MYIGGNEVSNKQAKEHHESQLKSGKLNLLGVRGSGERLYNALLHGVHLHFELSFDLFERFGVVLLQLLERTLVLNANGIDERLIGFSLQEEYVFSKFIWRKNISANL